MLTLLFAAALAFPVPAVPPIPVTTPVLQRPAGWQYGAQAASHGSMTLAVWNDRNGATACRIDADGKPLDPLGIVVRADAGAVDVFWSGTAFAVITEHATFSGYRVDSFYDVDYVDTDGAITRGNQLATNLLYMGHLGEGADTRLVFLSSDNVFEYPRFVGLEEMDASSDFPGDSGTFSALYRLTASNGSALLVLRAFQRFDGPEGAASGPMTFSSEVLELDGTSYWTDPHLPMPFEPAALTSDGHGGYALFGYRPAANEFVRVRLDARGVATGFPQFIQPYYPSPEGPGPVHAITFGGDVFASWAVRQPNGHTYTYRSRNGGIPEKTSDMTGTGNEAVYEPVNDLLFTSRNDPSTTSSVDLFVQKGKGAAEPLTYSANPQSNAAIAAGSNGFLAAWTEHSGTDARLYVRRFAADGTPVDEAQPADTAAAPFSAGSVTSSGDTYLVMWNRALARRLDAHSGQWLDATPFPLNAIAAASNGSDVLALTAEKCPSDCTMVRRVSMSGAAIVSNGVTLFDYETLSTPVIASDGQNYLAVWIDPECPSPTDCLRPPGSRVLSMRFRPDGSRIDAAPIVIQSSTSPATMTMPTVAWNGKTYLVAWMAPAYNGTIAAAYVGTDGSVQPLGTIAHFDRPVSFLKVFAQAGEFVFFSRSQPYEAQSPTEGELNMTLLNGATFPFEARTRGTILSVEGASDGAHLMLAFERANGLTTETGRVFLEPLFVPPRRTRAVR